MITTFRRSPVAECGIRANLARGALTATTHARKSTKVVPTPPVSAGGSAGGNTEVISS